MKKIYSIILLLTFLVGTLQPILPMIEYQLFEGDIIELLASSDKESCEVVRDFENNDCQKSEDHEDQQLLDTDYYPLALKITTIPDPYVFLRSTRFYLPIVKDAASPTFLPNPPPPRLS